MNLKAMYNNTVCMSNTLPALRTKNENALWVSALNHFDLPKFISAVNLLK